MYNLSEDASWYSKWELCATITRKRYRIPKRYEDAPVESDVLRKMGVVLRLTGGSLVDFIGT